MGGCVGYFAFFWVVRQGFYAIMLPPAMVGLGAGLLARRRSPLLAAICAVAGLGLGIITEWKFAPFKVDDSFSFFVTHLHELRSLTLILIPIGTIMSYRLALGMDQTQGRKE